MCIFFCMFGHYQLLCTIHNIARSKVFKRFISQSNEYLEKKKKEKTTEHFESGRMISRYTFSTTNLFLISTKAYCLNGNNYKQIYLVHIKCIKNLSQCKKILLFKKIL